MTPEQRHIQQFGKAAFQKRLVLANMCVRSDRRFIGMDKIRNRIAMQAALQATGYRRAPLKLTDLGHVDGPVQAAADELFMQAIAAAKVP